MPIEFRCNECGKLLRTDDETVGRQAQCPECGAISIVPSSTASSETSPSPFAPSPFAPSAGANPFGSGPAGDAESSDNSYQSPVSPTYLPPGQIDPALAAQRVAGPATALMVIAILSLIVRAGGVVVGLLQFGEAPMIQPQNRHDLIPMMVGGGANAVGGIFGIIVAVVILLGAMKMKKLESYGFSMAVAIIAMIPCFSPCCLGLPFGIWALVVLSDSSVKAAFRS
jgi:phage FluMu protein Com